MTRIELIKTELVNCVAVGLSRVWLDCEDVNKLIEQLAALQAERDEQKELRQAERWAYERERQELKAENEKLRGIIKSIIGSPPAGGSWG